MKLELSDAMINQIGILHDKYLKHGYELSEMMGCTFKEDWDFADLIRAIEKDCEEGVSEDSLYEKYID